MEQKSREHTPHLCRTCSATTSTYLTGTIPPDTDLKDPLVKCIFLFSQEVLSISLSSFLFEQEAVSWC